MAYEIYKTIRTEKEFYDDWEDSKLKELTDALRKYIYNKYVMKCKVFQRDGFKCLNTECKNPTSPLTVHHIKAQRNSVKHKYKGHTERNGITLCRACHKGLERGRLKIVLPNDVCLLSHIRGHILRFPKSKVEEWKKLREKAIALRKEFKRKGISTDIDWKTVQLLLRWLFVPYDEWDD